MDYFKKAAKLLAEFKGDSYIFGNDILNNIATLIDDLTGKCALIYTNFPGIEKYIDTIKSEIGNKRALVEVRGSGPNAPREEVFSIAEEIKKSKADFLISFGGGSTIDAVKAAEVLRTLGGDIDEYFGTGLVAEKLKESGKDLHLHMAIQTAASSAAHLTKYSNITDIHTGQKKLIVDDAVVPRKAVFDYTVTNSAPVSLISDGGLDGIAHIVEVLYGAVRKNHYGKMAEIAEPGVNLIVEYLPDVVAGKDNPLAREALCLGTDLGGYSIMVGGTNGGHLTSFSLVDVLTHGRACAIMNPFYTVFFAPAIEEPLQLIGEIYRRNGYIKQDISKLRGRDLGMTVAEGMLKFSEKIGFPKTLSEVDDFTDDHIKRALEAAKNPQLKMKLENMPVPLNAKMIDDYMGPILEAAKTGELSTIKNVE